RPSNVAKRASGNRDFSETTKAASAPQRKIKPGTRQRGSRERKMISSIPRRITPGACSPHIATPVAIQHSHARRVRARSHQRKHATFTVHISQKCMYIFASRE